MRERKRIDRFVLIRTFRRFKNNPLKIFVASELSGTPNIFRDTHLNSLIQLGLIEEVKSYFDTGKNKSIRMEVRGYKLK